MQNKSQISLKQQVITLSVVLMLMFGVSAAYAENPPLIASNTVLVTNAGVAKSSNLTATGGTGTLTYSKVSNSANGILTVNPDGSYDYTPNMNFSGTDLFTFVATDSNNTTSNMATVTITVLPVANDGSLVTIKNTFKTGTLSATGNGPFTYTVNQPTNGAVMPNPKYPAFKYTPKVDYTGSDSFTFSVTDANGFSSVQATVMITVNTGGGVNGRIFGTVTDISNKVPIGNVIINTNQKYSVITDQNGYYNMEEHPSGSYTLIAEADGYQKYNISGYLYPSDMIKHDIPLCPLTLPKGDLNGNKAVDLQDAISALKVLAGLGFSGCYSDVNGDNKIGLEEVIYILQIAAGLK